MTTNFEFKIRLLSDFFFSDTIEIDLIDMSSFNYLNVVLKSSLLIMKDEIRQAIKRCKSNSASESDDIFNRIFKIFVNKLMTHLMNLFRVCVALSYVGSYWLAKEWIATAACLKWMKNPAYYIENPSHSSIYWFSSSDSSRFIWGPRSSFVTRVFSSDQGIFVLRCHFDLISSESHIHFRIHWLFDNLENQ